MADLKRLTSFGKFNSGEGDRITYTYSVIDSETGIVKEQNVRGNFLVLDSALQKHVTAIGNYITDKFLTEKEGE